MSNSLPCFSFYSSVLRIGNECPDFSCHTTHGYWPSFHQWKKGQWAILCSHPRAFHPVGTTELASLSQKEATLESIGCKVVALSVDSVEDHKEWLKDVEAYTRLQNSSAKVSFPIISDGDRTISETYSMIDPFTMGTQTLTVRSVFVINPENILMLRLDYPACVGRNMDEIIRSVMALQLSHEHSIQTPANWPHNRTRVPSIDKQNEEDEVEGAVFLLPTVSKKEADRLFSDYISIPVPSGKNYLRMVRPEDTTEATESSELRSSFGPQEGSQGIVESKQAKAGAFKTKNRGLSRWFMAKLPKSKAAN